MDGRKAENYSSNAQRIRVITEDWVDSNMFCPYCGNKYISHFENNRPVADFFAWVKDILNNKAISSTDLRKALTYSLNQKKYLRVFLELAIIPLDNNDVERIIKKFCVGKHSLHTIDSKKGAKASAFLYSIAETAKANGLNPFEYFKFLMEQLKEYPRNDVPEEDLKKLMPWSETLPDCCKQRKKQS